MSEILSKSKVEDVLNILDETYPEAGCALDYNNHFELLCAVMLSAQTTDVSVNRITPALFDAYPDAHAMAKANPVEVEGIIRSIGLYKNKSRNLIRMSTELEEKYSGEVPGDYDSLTKLPGVGRKTANVVLAEGFHEQHIAVDTHVFRVANRIGMADSTDVLKTEKQLMQQIRPDRWTRAHHLLIFHGRNCCKARKPECDSCPIRDICLNRI